MARTPLLSSLQLLFRDILLAERQGIALEAARRLRIEARHHAPSRRDILAGSGALLAGGLLVPPARAAQQRIAIVGGGMAGLNAALTLQDRGVKATVFEAANRVGGRIYTDFTSWRDGQTSEWCAELLDTNHQTMFALVKRFRLTLLDRHKAGAKLADGQATNWLLGRYYTDAQAEADFRKISRILTRQLDAAPFPTTYKSFTKTGQALDRTSIRTWIETNVPGGYASPFGRLLDLAYDVEFGRRTSELSALNLLYLLGSQPDPNSLSMFGESDERFGIAGGNEKLIRAMAAALPRDTVSMGWRMTRIAQTASEVTLSFATPSGPVTQRFDKVILAIPFTVLRTLDFSGAGFDARKQTAIRELGYGANVKMHLEFDRRYWQARGPWPGSSNGESYCELYQNTWDAALAQPGPCGVLNNFTGSMGARFTPSKPFSANTPEVQAYARQFLLKLEKVWPGVGKHFTGTATLSCPSRDPNLLGSYASYLVGQYTKFGGYERVRQGRIHFAGEHTSTDFQGYMEGAAETGAQAAKDVLA